MREPLAFLRGQFVPQSQAALTLHDAGFVFGATATDLVRTFRRQLFRLADHVTRFRESCRLGYIPLQASDDDLAATAETLIQQNSPLLPAGGELALVMFATPGPLGHYAGLPSNGPPTLGMHTFPLPFVRYQHLFAEGAALVVPSTRHMPEACVDPRAKVRSRLFWWIAGQEAQAIEPRVSALLLDANNHVTETAAANFLIVQGNTLISPPRATILNGISLRVVEELCSELGLGFQERALTLQECQAADEALLAGTAFCVAGVRQLHGVELPWPGPVFQKLLAAWSAHVGLDIAEQFLSES